MKFPVTLSEKQRAKIARHFMQGGSCGFATRESVLVAYVLANYSDFKNLEVTERIKIRHSCELFVNGMISGDQLNNMALSCYTGMHRAFQILVNSVSWPLTTFVRDQMSKIDETVLLLASHGTKFWQPVCMFIGKTLVQALDRRKYVIKCLERTGLLTDISESHSRQEGLSLVHLEVVNIAPRTANDSAILKAQIMRLKAKAKKEILNMRMCNIRLQRQTKKLQNIIDQASVDAQSDSEEETDQSFDETEESSILSELNQWNGTPGRGRSYSDKLLSFSQLIALTSRKTYVLLRQVFPLPSLTCLKNHFSTKLAVIKSQLSGLSLVHEHISQLSSCFGENLPPVTLAVDAFAFQTFYETSPLRGSGQTMQYSNAFVFMCIPLDCRARPRVVHLMIRENGSFDAQVTDRLHEIIELYQRRSVPVLFTATDGDPFLTAKHNVFFQEHIERYQGGYSFLVGDIYRKLLETKEPMPISDPLHFSKNLRGKILDHCVAVIASAQPELINAEVLKSVLDDLGPTLDDKSRLGRMRDFYATSLFSLGNVCRLMKAKQYHSAFLLLPYACIFSILYAKNLASKTRFFLADLSFTCFSTLLEEANMLVESFKNIKYRYSKSTEAIVFAEPSYVKRMIHTCVAMGIVVHFGPETTRLDAVGTHLVENTIGIARTVSNSCRFNKIASAFSNAEMRRELAEKLELKLYVSRRINDGGAKIEPNSRDGLAHPQRWDPRDIVSLFREFCRPELRDALVEEMKKFEEEFFSFVEDIQERKMSPPSPVANCGILERNVHFCSGMKSECPKV